MDEHLSSPTPDSSQPPQEPHHLEHPAGARRVKRRLMYAMVGLYALSLGAGAILVLRGGGPSGSKKKGGADQGLLAMAEKDTVGWVPIHGVIMNSEGGGPWERGAEQW